MTWGDQPLEAVTRRMGQILGDDVRGYRDEFVENVLTRAMRRTQSTDLEHYLDRLARDAAEQAHVRRSLLVGVTSFFREPEAFEELRSQFMVPFLRRHGGGRPLRIWVVGCATGEEAYSVAITAFEAASEVGCALDLRLFASDVDGPALASARLGVWPKSIERHVSEDRLARFFVPHPRGYRVTRALRQRVLVVRHDIRTRAAFSRLDLISCRNVLFYLRADVRLRILRQMFGALRADGAIQLGRSETIGPAITHFLPLHPGTKLYVKRTASASPERAHHEKETPVVPSLEPSEESAEVLALNQELLAARAEREFLEKSLRALLGHTPRALLLVDASLRIRDASRLSSLGLPEAAAGDWLADFAGRLDRGLFEELVLRMRSADGSPFTLRTGAHAGLVITVGSIANADASCYPGAWLNFERPEAQ